MMEYQNVSNARKLMHLKMESAQEFLWFAQIDFFTML